MLNKSADVHGGWVQQVIEQKMEEKKHLESNIVALQKQLNASQATLSQAQKNHAADSINNLKREVEKIES